jgi:hypothetical protein
MLSVLNQGHSPDGRPGAAPNLQGKSEELEALVLQEQVKIDDILEMDIVELAADRMDFLVALA